MPGLLSLQIGIEDTLHAYRQCPVHPALGHLCASTVAYWDCDVQGHRFLTLLGLPVGHSSSELCFNRAHDRPVPSCSSLMIQEFVTSPPSHRLGGVRLDCRNSPPPTVARAFLGPSVNLAAAGPDGLLCFDSTPGHRAALCDRISSVLRHGRRVVPCSQASRSLWLGRRRNFGEASGAIRRDLRNCLTALLLALSPVACFLCADPPHPLVSATRRLRVYSDAAHEPHASSGA